MYYISYGSNMNIKQMAIRCPNTKVYGNGKLKGWKLVFNYHADIIETKNENDYVPVVVWKLTDEADEYNLDRYEGYPNYYTKINIPVVMDDTGETLFAMVYVMTKNRKGIYPPSSGYFECIYDGYIDNNIEPTPLFKAANECIDLNNITEYNQYNPREFKKLKEKKHGKKY